MGRDAGFDFGLYDCGGGGVCGFGFSEGRRLVESFGECSAFGWDVLFVVFFLEGEVGGGRRLDVVSRDWVVVGGLAVGIFGAVFGEFFGSACDVAEEAKEGGVWAVSHCGICSDFYTSRAATCYYLLLRLEFSVKKLRYEIFRGFREGGGR